MYSPLNFLVDIIVNYVRLNNIEFRLTTANTFRSQTLRGSPLGTDVMGSSPA
jgi:hypothetical protein